LYFGELILRKKVVESVYMKKISLLILFVFLQLFALHAQLSNQPGAGKDKYIDPAEAKEHFGHNNFLWAMPVYKNLLKQDPNNADYSYKLGMCYLNTNINKTLAIPHLKKASELNKTDKTILYNLGLAYQYAGKFDEAIASYKEYVKTAMGKDKEKGLHQIESCENAREFMKHPKRVDFENLGKDINSEFPDYYPFVSENENVLVYTSRRKDNLGGKVEVDGYFSSDIWISKKLDGKWQKPVNLGGPINTRYDEQAVSLSPDGTSMIVYVDRIDSLGNIYEAKEKEKAFKKMVKLSPNVNSDFETSGSISPYGNTIFFASKREVGFGETDIYMARKLPNGQWAKAQNLGKTINTPYKEDFPEIAPDGRTLYFSSQGHDGMGDFDLFQTTWDPEENTWSEPVNLGYPVNSVGEERSISFTKNNQVAYISALRPEGGNGDLDIYKITFHNDSAVVLQNFLRTSDSAKTFNATVEIVSKGIDSASAEATLYIPNHNTGKFISILTPGKYYITITAPGYRKYGKYFVVAEKTNEEEDVIKKYTLKK